MTSIRSLLFMKKSVRVNMYIDGHLYVTAEDRVLIKILRTQLTPIISMPSMSPYFDILWYPEMGRNGSSPYRLGATAVFESNLYTQRSPKKHQTFPMRSMEQFLDSKH